MTILNIETSTTCCSAAITIDDSLVASVENLTGANHASELPVFIKQLLAQAQANNWCLDAVALSQGPGSYTGLRIGSSIAKGICYGLNIPLIPIDTLQILCNAVHNTSMLCAENTLLCPMLDARRMEVYTALYNPNTLEPLTDITAQVINQDSFAELLKKNKIYFFGNGATKCQSIIQSPNAVFIPEIQPQAAFMGQLAKTATPLDVKQMAYYEPFYLKEFVAAPSHVKGLK